MAGPSSTVDQNLLPVQAYFDVYGNFQTFIGQGQPFFATFNPNQSGLHITNSTIDSTTIGATTPSTGSFTNMTTITGQVTSTPVNPNDLTNKSYVDAVIQGLSFKAPAQVTTTANITLSGLQTIDGYTTAAGDRVLVRNQTLTQNNGIYNASATAWTRSSDADTYAELVAAFIFIENGTIYTGSAWVSTIPATGTLGTTPITFTQFSNTALYNAGTGLTLSGYTFSITPVGTAGTYGSASAVPVLTTNASGQVTSVTNTSIAIAGSQITSGTIGTSYLTGSYTGITGVGTLTAGTWNASTVTVPYGGTGAATFTAGYLKASGTSAFSTVASIPSSDITGLGTMSTQNANAVAITGGTISGLTSPLPVASGGTGANSLTGYIIGSGTTAFTASSTIPTTNLSGTITNAQLANSSITINGSSISLGGTATVTANTTNALTIGTGLSGTSFNGSTAVTIANTGVLSFSAGTTGFTPSTTSTGAITLAGLLALSNGGTNANLTAVAGGVIYSGASAFAVSAAGTTGQYLQSNGAGIPTWTTVTAGVSITDDTTSVTSYYPLFSRITTGTTSTEYVSSTKLNYTPSTGLLAATTFSGSGASLTSIPNSALTNSSITIGSTAVSLGATVTTIVGLTSVTSTTFVGALTGNASTATTATTATNATNVAVTDNTSSSATWYPTLVSTTTGNLPITTSSTKLSFIPSTGVLSATSFTGAGTGLTGTASININGTVGATTPSTGAFTSINTANTFGFKNRLINGYLAIDQRNAGASQSIGLTSAYTVDRWYALSVGIATTGQRIAGSNGFEYSYQFTGALTNTGTTFGQKIESYNSYDLASSTVTLSAYIKASALTTVTWTAYYPTAIDNYTARTQISTGTFTINTNSTQYSVNVSLPANVVNGLQIEFTTAALASGTIVYTGVQLEKGSTATSFDYRPYGTELQLCQRYFNSASMNLAGYTASGVTNSYIIYLVQTMRATPTYTAVGSTNINVSGSIISPISSSVIQFSCIGTGTGGYIGSANGNLSAEL